MPEELGADELRNLITDFTYAQVEFARDQAKGIFICRIPGRRLPVRSSAPQPQRLLREVNAEGLATWLWQEENSGLDVDPAAELGDEFEPEQWTRCSIFAVPLVPDDKVAESALGIYNTLLEVDLVPEDQAAERLLELEARVSGIEEVWDTVLIPGKAMLVVTQYVPYTLQDVIQFGKSRVVNEHYRSLFLLYQLVKIVDLFHRKGLPLGDLEPSICLCDEELWLSVSPWHLRCLENFSLKGRGDSRLLASKSSPCLLPAGFSRYELVQRWTECTITNFEYLMNLNEIAGRRTRDAAFHPILPWVSDLKEEWGGWRDMSQTKFRLTRGDAQLEVTFRANAANPHHITESLSELGYTMYNARRLPKQHLLRLVRSRWQPDEYPATMERLYEWTPDECIPEFFTDPGIFKSRHSDMCDLAVPAWSKGPAEFVAHHMRLLESEEVSSRLHAWIDLTFGYKLMGEAAAEAKNVPLAETKFPSNKGFCVLFNGPHPRRSSARGIRNDNPSLLMSSFVSASGDTPSSAPSLKSETSFGSSFTKKESVTSAASTVGKTASGSSKSGETPSRSNRPKRGIFAGLRKAIENRVDMDMLMRPSGAGTTKSEEKLQDEEAEEEEAGGVSEELGSLKIVEDSIDVSWESYQLLSELEDSEGVTDQCEEFLGSTAVMSGSAVAHSNEKSLDGLTGRDIWSVGILAAALLSGEFLVVRELATSDLSAPNILKLLRKGGSTSVDVVHTCLRIAAQETKSTEMPRVPDRTPSEDCVLPDFCREAIKKANESDFIVGWQKSKGDHESGKSLQSGEVRLGAFIAGSLDDDTTNGQSSQKRDSVQTDGPSEATILILKHPIFPAFFEKIYRFHCQFRISGAAERLLLCMNFLGIDIQEKIPSDAFLITLPLFKRVLQTPETAVEAATAFLPVLCKIVGPKVSRDELLPILVGMLNEDQNPSITLALVKAGALEPPVLESWLRCFGLSAFLESILPQIIGMVASQQGECAKPAGVAVGKLMGDVLGDGVGVNFLVEPVTKLLGRPYSGEAVAVLISLGDKFGDAFSRDVLMPRLLSVFVDSSIDTDDATSISSRNSAGSDSFPGENEREMEMSGKSSQLPEFLQEDPGHSKTLFDHLQVISALVPLLSPVSLLHAFAAEGSPGLRLLSQPHSAPSAMLAASTTAQVCQKIGPDWTKKYFFPPLANWFMSMNQVYGRHLGLEGNPLGLGGPSRSKEVAPASARRARLKEVFSPEVLHAIYVPLACLVPVSDQLHPQWRSALRSAVRNFNLIESILQQELRWDPRSTYSNYASTNPTNTTLSEPWVHVPYKSSNTEQSPHALLREAGKEWHFEGTLVRSFKGHTGVVKVVSVHPDERLLVSGGRDATVRVWSLQSQKCQGVYVGHRESVGCAKVLPIRNWVASSDGEIHVWDIEVLQRLYTYKAHLASGHTATFTASHHMNARDFSGNHGTLIVGSSAKYPGPVTMKVFDMRQQSRSIEWHLPPSLNNVCYIAQEGSALWAGTVSGQLVILDLRTGVVRCAWQGHDGAVTGIESLDNGTVTTTSSDRTIATWNCAASPANDVGLAWDNAWGSSPEHIQWWGKENQDKLYLTEPLIGLARFGGRYSAALASGVVLAKPPGEIYQSRLKDFRSNVSSIASMRYSRLLVFGCEDGKLRACY